MSKDVGKYINPLTDLKNVVDTSKEEGLKQGIEQVAKKMKLEGFTKENIQKLTGLSIKEIDDL